ncbi:Hypothetical predicted protein [Podarcis lilfordi]|uniref:Uncharacterized protein n=1 Tax=Podarcis lilfordi TaxID=74358 RepID=A0AA35NYF0_9SAUR|nr:Hypothetical predicted protein [Podarcis lilfordi]
MDEGPFTTSSLICLLRKAFCCPLEFLVCLFLERRMRATFAELPSLSPALCSSFSSSGLLSCGSCRRYKSCSLIPRPCSEDTVVGDQMKKEDRNLDYFEEAISSAVYPLRESFTSGNLAQFSICKEGF